MPGGKDVGKNIEELYARNKQLPKGKRRSRAQIIAIAESQARAVGGGGPKKKKKGG